MDSPRVALIRRLFDHMERNDLAAAAEELLRNSAEDVVFQPHASQGKEIRGQRPSSSVELAALVLEHAEVAVVPGEAFGTPGYFRLSYALGDDDLTTGVNRMAELLGEAKD